MGSVGADSISARIIKNTFIQTIDMYEYILSDFCCNAKPFPLYNCNPKGCGNPGGYGIYGRIWNPPLRNHIYFVG